MKQSTKEQKVRLKMVTEACKDEIDRANKALSEGKIAIVKAFCGEYQLTGVSDGFWYYSFLVGSGPDSYNRRSWCGCNDGQWVDIMQQLELPRNPLFARKEEK